jgi:glutamate carboxypeptidase
MLLWLQQQAREISERALTDLTQLVNISSPAGDSASAEAVFTALTGLLPEHAHIQRLSSSTPGYAKDLLVRIPGSGSGRLLLLGHVDTVISHAQHRPLQVRGDQWQGSGTYDMKGGLVIACGVMRALAARPQLFEQMQLLVTADEEAREKRLKHVLSADACLCFEGGERYREVEAVVARRKGAYSLSVHARGRAAHSGTVPAEGRSALEVLAALVPRLTVLAVDGDEELSVVPTRLHAGGALNVVPAEAELICDVRAFRKQTARNVLAMVPEEMRGVSLRKVLSERFPPMDTRLALARAISDSAQLLGHPLWQASRGGSSDACFMSEHIPVTVDGLGPRGGGDHGLHEYVLGSSFTKRSEIALALALTATSKR